MGISFVSMFFPYLHEVMNAKARADGYEQNWSAIYFGFVAHLVSWSVMFIYFFTGIGRDEPPAFVSTIVMTLFFLLSHMLHFAMGQDWSL